MLPLYTGATDATSSPSPCYCHLSRKEVPQGVQDMLFSLNTCNVLGWIRCSFQKLLLLQKDNPLGTIMKKESPLQA